MLGKQLNFLCFIPLHVSKHCKKKKKRIEQKENDEDATVRNKKKGIRLRMKLPKI